MIVAALNVDITKFHTNHVPPCPPAPPRIHFMLMLFAQGGGGGGGGGGEGEGLDVGDDLLYTSADIDANSTVSLEEDALDHEGTAYVLNILRSH